MTRRGFGAATSAAPSLADPELTDAVLDEPNLANAVIRGGSLTRVLVSGGRLTGAQWAETRIHDTVWRNAAADLSAFRLSELVRVTFDSCNLREADFTGASCSWVRFHDCDLTGAVFSKARFANSELRRCRLEAVEGVAGLAGTSMEFDAVLGLAPQLADALGIHLLGLSYTSAASHARTAASLPGGRRFSCGGPAARRTSAATRAAWSNDHQWELTWGG